MQLHAAAPGFTGLLLLLLRVGVGVGVVAAATFVITMLLRTEQRWSLISEGNDLTDMKTQQTSRADLE